MQCDLWQRNYASVTVLVVNMITGHYQNHMEVVLNGLAAELQQIDSTNEAGVHSEKF